MSDTRVQSSRGDYEIAVRRGGLAELGDGVQRAAPKARNVMLAMDEAVQKPWGERARSSLVITGFGVSTIALKADESQKCIAAVERVWAAMLQAGMQRNDVLVALGGGVIGDLAGFAAATYQRGIPLVMAPTTLLAMVDASIGGKTAVNLPLPSGGLGKNMAGAFHAPAWVLADINTLETLSDRDFRCGLAECVKHALICDPQLLGWIEANRARIASRDPDTLQALVERSAEIKATIVSADEFEEDGRSNLNLGHTFAHALESVLHDELRHGEAVAIGLVAAAAASRTVGLEGAMDPQVLAGILAQLGLPTRVPRAVDRHALLAAMAHDKKGQGGVVPLVLMTGGGPVRSKVAPEVVAAGWSAVGA